MADLVFEFGPTDRIVGEPSLETRHYTDDTQMAICVAETLVDCQEISEERLCAAFCENYDPARCYGQGARRVLEAMIQGDDWRTLANTIFPGGSFGNGAAMHVAPIGVFFCDDLDRVASQAVLSATPTHLHPLGIDGARVLAIAVALAVRERSFDRSRFFHEFSAAGDDRGISIPAFNRGGIAPHAASLASFGNGLEAHRSVVTAIACFASAPENYGDAIGLAIGQGGDTDTLAAMAGAISGAIILASRRFLPSRRLVGRSAQGPPLFEQLGTRLFDLHRERTSAA